MQELAALASIVATLTVGVVSPGPSFVMVARVAVASSRSRALATALGMVQGAPSSARRHYSGYRVSCWLYVGLKALGGLYLCYLGFLIFRSAKRPLAIVAGSGQGSSRPLRSFWPGVTTQVSNPKTAIVYASVFAAFLPAFFSLGSLPSCLQPCSLLSPPGTRWSPFSSRRPGPNGPICRTSLGLIERPVQLCSAWV
jgi:threonine/homoserine/homoserine lactone efflux protein